MKLIHTEPAVLFYHTVGAMEVQNFGLWWKSISTVVGQSWDMGEATDDVTSLFHQQCLLLSSAHPSLRALMKAHTGSWFFSRFFSPHQCHYLADWGQVGSCYLPALTSPALLLFYSNPLPFLLPFFPVLHFTSQCDAIPAGGWEPDSWPGQAALARAMAACFASRQQE